ncbi:MAG TPA: hypothetical protein VEH50_14035 [Methylomirabilota bacterium]|nr:hypothetical protein [Methylomirabilota bacterium]
MESQVSDLQALADRVEKLERQNRWFKRGGLALALIASCLFVMAQVAPIRTIEADDFILKDSKGMKRAELSVPSANPVLRFFDSGGNVNALVGANGYIMFGSGTRTYPGQGNESFRVPITKVSLTSSGLFFADQKGSAVIQLGGLESPGAPALVPHLTFFDSSEQPRVDLGINSSSPYLNLTDGDGFSAQLGSSDLITPSTGEKHKTSAASLVLFGKDGKVLWSAP